MNYKLFLLSILLVFVVQVSAIQSPHGEKFKKDCAICHVTVNWKKIKPDGFNHNTTKFPLVGQHKMVDCRNCHTSLIFKEASSECSSCHKDIHEGTVGNDCGSCHTSNSWIVNNVRRIHQRAGFPLIGEHASADCNRCHTSASLLRFNNIRSDCYSCHQYQYELTSKPNHKLSGYGIDCQTCHNMAGMSWLSIGKGFDHGIFPLTGAHNVQCGFCHVNNDYRTKLSSECSSCHDPGPAKTTSPAHTTKFLNFACADCHNTISWTTVKFPQHDGSYGRIYSGRHRGTWSSCSDCHKNDANYTSYCNKCHDFNSGPLP
jgi:ribosomal protein S27E